MKSFFGQLLLFVFSRGENFPFNFSSQWYSDVWLFQLLTFAKINDFSVWLFQVVMTFRFNFTADDDLLDPDSYSDGLVLGCVRLPFTGSLSSTCLHVCLGHGHPRKYGLHITDTWISNQSGIFIVSTPLTQIPVLKLIIQENLII